MIRRVLLGLGFGYLVLAMVGLARERSGAITCPCQPDCWCKRPGMRLLRWVFPFGHRL